MTQLIRHDGAIVAVAGPTLYYLAPELTARPVGDRTRSIVTLMCLFAHELSTGTIPGTYSDERAERYATYVLGPSRATARPPTRPFDHLRPCCPTRGHAGCPLAETG